MENLISNIEPYTFTGSAIIIGLLLTKEIPIDEQGSVGNWLQVIGLVIQTYSSQASLVNSEKEKEKSDTIESLKKAIDKIQDELEKLQK